MGSLGDAAARGTGVTMAGQACRFVLQMASVVVLARLLVPDDFGLVAMVLSISGIAEIIRDFGLSSAAVQARDLNDGERTNLFWANVLIGAGCGVLVAAAAPLIVVLYGEPRLAPIVLVLSGVFLVTGANTQFKAELVRALRFRVTVLADVLAQAAGIGVAIGLAVAGAGYWAIVAQQVVVPVVTLVVNAASCSWRPGLPRRSAPIGRFFRFGGGVMGTQLLSYATKNADNVVIGAFLGPAQLGFYSRAYQLLMTPLNQINAPMTSVALPVLSRVQDDQETYERYLARAQMIGCYLTATVLAVCAGLAVPIVAVLFGPGWEPVAPVFAILAVGGVFRAVAQLSYWIYLSRGLTGAQLRLFLVVRPLMIVLIVAGLPWGIEGVALGCTLGAVLQWVVPMWHVGRVANVDAARLLRRALLAMARVSLPTGLLALAASMLPWPAVLQVLAGLVLVAGYLAVLALAVRGVREDLVTIARFGRRAFSRAPAGPNTRGSVT